MSYILTVFTVVCLIAWLIDRRLTFKRGMEDGQLVGRLEGFQRGCDTAVVDCQIKRGQEDRARRERNGQWKKKGAKA